MHHPLIYEINTWPWLKDLRDRYGSQITLNDIPEEIINQELTKFDAIWLMGIWERSPESRRIARNHAGLQGEFHKTLNNLKTEDIVGSPYAIYGYHLDPHLGTMEGLQSFAARLHKRKIKLIVDFVPNHVACDHSWSQSHPEYFIQGTTADLEQDPNTFFQSEDSIFAHGKDPYFDAWTDTLQINAFSQSLRDEIKQLIKWIASFADGVRCDMAMLLNTTVFQQTWKNQASTPLPREFWEEIIGAVKGEYPEFIFIAEVYWDMEWDLQQLGFDFCYDKRLYDRLRHGDMNLIRGHLNAEWKYQKKLLRFIENHDEPRAFSTFGEKKAKILALLLYTLPGARLIHQGQVQGRKIKFPVQLGRLPRETRQTWLEYYYRELLDLNFFEAGSEGSWHQINPEITLKYNKLNPILSYYWDFPSRIVLVLCNFADYELKITIPTLNFNPSKNILNLSWVFNSDVGFVEEREMVHDEDSFTYTIPKLTGTILMWNKK